MPKLSRRFVLPAAAVFLSALAGCSTQTRQPAATSAAATTASSKPQLFKGMGDHHMAVSNASPLAQQYFDQALTWTYAFNHDEAIRSFEECARLSPNCAMAWWGVALCHGPHINNPVMSPERSQHAWAALQKAVALRAGASPIEQELIDALSARYASPTPADRIPLDQAYARAMDALAERHPTNADVTTLAAEALMDLRPWDLWTQDGSPQPGTERIVALIERALALDSTHPGANHLYIHAVEASPIPQRAVAAANRLRTLVPASSHLVHMPAHIDIRVGDWDAAVKSNQQAIAADKAYRALSPHQDFYRVYMMHNQHFLAFACMMSGRSAESLKAARAALATVPPEWVAGNASIIDGYMTIEIEALKRFGKWDDLLALPAPNEHLPFTRAIWREARTVAYAAKGDLPAARRERVRFMEACTLVPKDAHAQINPAHTVLELATHVIDGEIAYAQKDYSTAEQELRAAAAIEDTLRYMEPPDWMLPARHTLGAVLLDQGRFADAEAVFRQDLVKWPENGWALLGLTRSLEGQGKAAEAAQARARSNAAWKNADITPHSSCLCAPKARASR